tara:strand:+ start:3302 stop:4042 length:741 start_codon:yes stop_codon:yes gene_type:complete
MLKKIIKNFLKLFGYNIISNDYPIDFTKEDKKIIEEVSHYTMTSPERIKCLIEGTKYVVKNKIEGSFVECGVWKGGSVMVSMLILKSLNTTNREFYLYDTFDGMSEPTEHDTDFSQNEAKELLKTNTKNKENKIWCFSPLEDVKNNLSRTKYPEKNIHYIKGKVEETLKLNKPEKIALLRLDTDWYESTKFELENLFPKLEKGGVLIVDDYGYWRGSKKAVDDYFANEKNIFFHRIDETGIMIIKN